MLEYISKLDISFLVNYSMVIFVNCDGEKGDFECLCLFID